MVVTCDVLPQGILSVEAAQAAILTRVQTLTESEQTPLIQAAGRVLAEPIYAHHAVPPYRNSAMDGYALRHADLALSRPLRIIGSSFAGHPYSSPLQAGECVRIMTGAVMPEGADTVLMQENAQRDHDQLHPPTTPLKQGSNVRHIGDDLTSGSLVLDQGRVLNAADIGLLASLGIVEISVIRRPTVAFFSTGDELQNLGQPLGYGQIYDSNRYTLRIMLEKLGVTCIDMGIIPDQITAVENAFQSAMQQADMLITSGGVSVGEADFVAQTLQKLGRINFWKMAMKPGKPLAFGSLGDCLFFGLPGNPVSTMATFLLFVRPALLKLAGHPMQALPNHSAICTTPLKKEAGRKDYQRGIASIDANGQWQVTSTGLQESHVLRSMSLANCFIVLPREWGDVASGSKVEIIPFSGLL